MTISAKTTKMLWGRAAARCSMPGCRIALVLEETETDDPALLGEMAHMVAESEDGPRGKSPLTSEQRDLYDNLILLCRNHHVEIDRQVDTWPVERLKQIKHEHEAWVKASLPGYDAQKQRDDEIYTSYVDEWARRCGLDNWTSWVGSLLSNGQPSLDREIYQELINVPRWIMKRVWPGRYPKLENAFRNFGRVLNDLLATFQKHSEEQFGGEVLNTKKFYKIDHWNDELYHRLHRQFEHHVDVVEDLTLELTRAANLVCDLVRSDLLSSFRLADGKLSIMSGPHMDLTWRETVVEYDQQERANPAPYPGLDEFLIQRADRDMHFGVGPAPTS